MRAASVAVIGALALLATATVAFAQSAKPLRVGVLVYGAVADNESKAVITDLQKGLTDLGYVEGRDVDIVYQSGSADQLSERAGNLVRRDVNIIVAVRDPAAHAATKATTTIPIVVTEYGADPVKGGLAASLRRPGGNVTGNVMQSDALWENRLGKHSSMIPMRCQYWFKVGDTYYVSDSDEDRSAKLLAGALKQ